MIVATVKASLWALTIALIIGMVLGPVFIPLLRRLKAGQSIREDAPERHQSKAGTPTMGGIIFITAIIIAALVTGGLNTSLLNALLVMTAFGAIGFMDDYIKVVLKRNLGLRARDKLFWQLIVSLFFTYIILYQLDLPTTLLIPFTNWQLSPPVWLYVILVLGVLVGCSNAVNLTDGLDGLAAGVTVSVGVGYWLVAMMTKSYYIAPLAAAVVGGCLAFLWFNRHPARIFMGDTGSMALGGVVAALAVTTKTELALLLIGGIYVAEALSVIIQVVSFKRTGKRVFRMAPLHHHFELMGHSEVQVVRRFWVTSLIMVIIGLLSLYHIGIKIN
ncbi:MAG: phospho-N-acetylmuramoyl-pentapeptide-transferase [Methylocystaceae bacterium]